MLAYLLTHVVEHIHFEIGKALEGLIGWREDGHCTILECSLSGSIPLQQIIKLEYNRRNVSLMIWHKSKGESIVYNVGQTVLSES